MIKPRIIACLIVRDGLVVQSIGFHRYLPVGRPDIAVRYLNRWGVDEIVVLDISATGGRRDTDLNLVRLVARNSLVPVAVGGGVHTAAQMCALIQAGADKVAVNSAWVDRPELLREGAERLGNQAIVVSIDCRRAPDGSYDTYTRGGTTSLGKSPVELARRAVTLGAGEILLTSIDRDGSKQGYDLNLLRSVAPEVQIPVIACGGVGHPAHFLEGLGIPGVHAVAAGNFFHFTEHSVIVAKSFLRAHEQAARIDTHSAYPGFGFTEQGRVAKLSQTELEGLRFRHVEEEHI